MDINFLQKRIKDLCDQHHISIDKMLKECNLKPSVVDNIKKGSIPAVDKVLIIAEYFNVSIYYLLGLDDVPNRKEKIPTAELTNIEKECLNAFNNLIPEDKIRFISRMEQRYEDYTPEQKENVS